MDFGPLLTPASQPRWINPTFFLKIFFKPSLREVLYVTFCLYERKKILADYFRKESSGHTYKKALRVLKIVSGCSLFIFTSHKVPQNLPSTAIPPQYMHIFHQTITFSTIPMTIILSFSTEANITIKTVP